MYLYTCSQVGHTWLCLEDITCSLLKASCVRSLGSVTSVHQSKQLWRAFIPSKPRADWQPPGRSSRAGGTPKHCRGVTAAQAPRLSKCEEMSGV